LFETAFFQQDQPEALGVIRLTKQLMDRSDVDIWFADESGFEGDPRSRKRWDKIGLGYFSSVFR